MNEYHIENEFGQLVLGLHVEINMSQEKLSELSGLCSPYVYKIERGDKTASIRTLVKLADGLDILPSSLILDMDKSL